MKILVNAVHFTADQSLIDFVHKKLKKIETFYDRITTANIYLKLDKGEKSAISKKLVEVNLNVPGSTIFVKESGNSFEEAIDITMDVLSRKVKRFKQRHNEVSHERVHVEPLNVNEN